MIIMIDPGHGGKDPGAVNEDAGRQEKDIAFAVAQALTAILTGEGHEVIMTRNDDVYVSPGERMRQANRAAPDAFISIHCNASSNPSATGVETIYRDINDFGLALMINNALVKETGMRNRGLKTDIGDLKRRLSVLSCNTEIAACLVEIGFISNESDLESIEDTSMVARAIADGVGMWA